MKNNAGYRRQMAGALLICALTCLLLGGCAGAPANSPSPSYPLETGSLRITTAEGQNLGEVSLQDIQNMKAVTRRLVVHSTGGDETCDFKGTLLSNVLAAVDPALLQQYDAVSVIGADDYVSYVSMEEVAAENNVYIMYANGEEALSTRDGLPSGMRLVILKDFYGQRFTNYLTELRLERKGTDEQASQ